MSQKKASTHTHSPMHTPNFPTCLYSQFQFVTLRLFLSSVHSLFMFKIQANKIPSNIFLNQRRNDSEKKQNNYILPHLYENFTEACFVT